MSGPGGRTAGCAKAEPICQDSWRIRPNLSVNAGVRYDVQMPFVALNSLYSYATIDDLCGVSGKKSDNSCNLFQAGNMPGVKPTFKQLEAGTDAYNTDYNNIAPTVGFAWTPGRPEGFMGDR